MMKKKAGRPESREAWRPAGGEAEKLGVWDRNKEDKKIRS
jgi:hypothetical protein